MSQEGHLCYVNSRTRVSDELWKEWYMTEHLPDVISSGCATRCLLYEEIPTPFNATPDNPAKFMALYLTKHADVSQTENIKQVRTTSELFLRDGGTETAYGKNGEFEVRNYDLIQVYDPMGIGNTPSPQILTAEMHPKDTEDFEKWYREEHLDMLKQVAGYRRALRYKLGAKVGKNKDNLLPEYLAIHEVEDLREFGSDEGEAASNTPWTQKHMNESKVLFVRGWKLVSAHGY